MHLTGVALVAGLSALSNAFLIPPNFPTDVVKDARFREEHEKHHKDLIHAILQQTTTVVDLECPGCPFAIKHSEERSNEHAQSVEWMGGVENTIHLEFETPEHGLHINGQPVFPLEVMMDSGSYGIKATQIRKDTHERSVEFELNFALEQSQSLHPPIPDVEVIPLRFTILGLSGSPVKVDSVDIHLVKTPGDEYTVAFAHVVPFQETPGAEECEGSGQWSLCRARAILAAQMNHVIETMRAKSEKASSWFKTKSPFKPHKGCGGKGKPYHGVFRPFAGVNELDQNEDGRPHSGRHHGGRHHHHKHHHRYHRLGHVMHQTLRFFVIPALLGVSGGLLASAIGMLVGRFIVFLWCKVYRSGQRGPLRTEREYQIVLVEDEKEGLLVAELPAEDQLPAYTDVEGGEVSVKEEKN